MATSDCSDARSDFSDALSDFSEFAVDSSAPTRVFKGKLRRDKVALQAQNQRDAHDEPEPAVLAWVRIQPQAGQDGKPDIGRDLQIPLDQLLTGVEVNSRVRCGRRAMGYSLFYGVWEFFYEKVVFFF